MSETYFVLQPGEVSAEGHRRGHGPAMELRDGAIHPAVASRVGSFISQGVVEVSLQPDDKHTYSGPDFDKIAFAD